MGFPVKYLSGRDRFVGFGLITDVPIALDPTQYEGAMVYGMDKRMYYSDGNVWVKLLEVPIDQPAALPPTNAEEQLQLRLTAYRSSAGYIHSATEFSAYRGQDPTDPNNTLLLSVTKQRNPSLPYPDYDLTYYQLGLQDLPTFGGFGAEYWWSGIYFGGGFASDPSVMFRQVFPKQLQDPVPLTINLETTDVVEIDPFDTAFPNVFVYDGSRVELYEIAADGTPGAQVGSGVDYSSGDSQALNGVLDITSLPTKDGVAYFWRAQHFTRPIQLVSGISSDRVASAWTDWRVVRTTPNTLVLVYDLTKRTSSSRLVELPLQLVADQTCTVDWGDGTTSTIVGPSSTWISHTWAGTAKQLEIRVAGKVTGLGNASFLGKEENQKILIACTAIGTALELTSLAYAFVNCVNLVQMPDYLPKAEGAYPGITSLYWTFYNCAVFNWDISRWDVQRVASMAHCFHGCESFNQNIGVWDVGSVTSNDSFRSMFAGCTAFDRSLNDWGNTLVRGATLQLDSMFEGCVNYNGPMDKWTNLNIDSVMAMFAGCTVFNQDLGSWDVSNCTDFARVFDGAQAFNKPLAGWDTRNARSMQAMFRNANAFNQDLSSWDVGAVSDFDWMFDLSGILEASRNPVWGCNVGGWQLAQRLLSVDTQINVNGMFRHQLGFNDDITAWPMLRVDSASEMLHGCASFNRDVSVWDVSKIRNMFAMFQNCTAFNAPIGNWSFANIGGPTGTDSGAIRQLLYNCATFNQPINWNLNHLGIRSLYGVFYGCKSLGANGVAVNAGSIFDPANPKWAKYVTDIGFMFGYCSSFNEDLSNWMLNDPSAVAKPNPVTSMRSMLTNCTSFTNGDNSLTASGIGGWDVSKVQYFDSLFYNCSYFNRNVSSWDVRQAINVSSMFHNCSRLSASVIGANWKLPLCTNMSFMFFNARAFNQNVNGLFSEVANAPLKFAQHAFRSCVEFNNGQAADLTPGTNAPVAGTVPLTWSLPVLEDTTWMFKDALKFNQNVNSLKTAPLKACWGMFQNTTRFNNGGLGGEASPANALELDVTRVADFSTMLQYNDWFNQSIDYLTPTVGTTFVSMMERCQRFNQPIATFGSKLSVNAALSLNLDSFFASCYVFNQPLDAWRFSRASSLKKFLYNCPQWKRSMALWDVSNVFYMSDLLGSSSSLYATGMTETDYANTLTQWVNLVGLETLVTVNFGTSPPNAAAVSARTRLVELKFWTVRDGSGLYAPTVL